MVRLTLFAAFVFCLMSVGFAALANESVMSAAAIQTQTPDASRLLAMEIAARAQGGNAQGKFTPTQPRAPMIAPSMQAAGPAQPAAPALTCGAPNTAASAAATAADGGMHFMPLRRGVAAREFPLPSRGEITATAQTLRAAVAGSKGESDLAQTALQVANMPTAQAQAANEVASITGRPGPSADPSALAHDAVLHEIQRYRATHGQGTF